MFKKKLYSPHDLAKDVQAIKVFLAKTTNKVKGKAEDLFSQSLESAKDKTCSIQKKMHQKVVNQPGKFLTMAILGGIVVGYLLNSRK